ncbi:MAG: ATP-binding protein [Novosphingobium sp.]|nr:ATP-binding protein [Novosphingobium sp.]
MVRQALADNAATVLLGPRQVGKSTLARMIAAERPHSVYLDLELDQDLRKLDDAAAYLRSTAGRLTVIDEVHRTPQLFATLRSLIDERRRAGHKVGEFLLLGSASLDLVQHSAETLAGRVTYIELQPVGPQDGAGANIGLDRLWLRGGFPDSLLARDDGASLRWRKAFIRSYLQRDVPMFAPRMPSVTIGRLWTMLAHGQGTLLNTARLAQALAVSAPMAGRYIDLLVDLLLVRRLAPWSGNLGKRLVRSPKLYVRDCGLVHALLDIGTGDQLLGHPVVGASWEGLAIEALIDAAGPHAQFSFYRTAAGAEIDLVIERGGRVAFAIEIKRSTAPKVEQGFYWGANDIGAARRIVVTPGGDRYPLRDGAEVMPLLQAIEEVIPGDGA